MGNSHVKRSRKSASRAGARVSTASGREKAACSRDDRVDAKFTFVVHGGEVLAIFRAIRDPEGKWRKETPYIDGSGRAVLNCYAHSGQHGTCCPEILWDCRRAKPEEYLPLKRELEEIIGYNVETVQRGRLHIKEETGYAACYGDDFRDFSGDFGCYKVFTGAGARGRALDWLTDYIFERAAGLGVKVVDQGAKLVRDKDGNEWFPEMTWEQVRDQLGSGMDFGLVTRAEWEYGSLTVKDQARMGIREVTVE